MSYVPPKLNLDGFSCPHCQAFTEQKFADAKWGGTQIDKGKFSRCSRCKKYSYWVGQDLVYPKVKTSIEPNSDLSEEIQKVFNEAVEAMDVSPRAASALFRLCLEKICQQILGERSRKKVNQDIKTLVGEGLSPTIQKALDYVRVVGNNAVHPGTIQEVDNKETAVILAKLINKIAETMITEPKEIDTIYQEHVPEDVRAEIDKRDRKNISEEK